MTKFEFLNDNDVIGFVTWVTNKLDNSNSFHHAYQTKKPNKSYEFHNIYDAFENYCWSFKYLDENNVLIEGSSYSESSNALKNIKSLLLRSIDENDFKLCQTACLQVLKWGGVLNKNQDVILELNTEIIQYMEHAYSLLHNIQDIDKPSLFELYMSSGFTKIYSLLVDDFIIYDSRVGASLCFLVRKYCQENALNKVPLFLQFSWAMARSKTYSITNNTRNPGNSMYCFPTFAANKDKHLSDNIKASWLLEKILNSTSSKFNLLPKKEQLRAMEAALFMIGYQVNFNNALE